jgi:hypothetical protein
MSQPNPTVTESLRAIHAAVPGAGIGEQCQYTEAHQTGFFLKQPVVKGTCMFRECDGVTGIIPLPIDTAAWKLLAVLVERIHDIRIRPGVKGRRFSIVDIRSRDYREPVLGYADTLPEAVVAAAYRVLVQEARDGE